MKACHACTLFVILIISRVAVASPAVTDLSGPSTRALIDTIDTSATPVAGYEIVHTYPHDPLAFTQGLVWADGGLYESTGLENNSSLRRVELETGKVLRYHALPPEIFAEGIAAWGDQLIQLTWRNHEGYLYHRRDLYKLQTFSYTHEGWGITSGGQALYVSDGTPTLRIWNPETYETSRTLEVKYGGKPLQNLNELEWVEGEIWANIWKTRLIARIDPDSGAVRSWIDLSALPTGADAHVIPQPDVLNGIAWDPEHRRLFVTGKYWPALYELRIPETPKRP